jgi:hypothetical protein
VVYQKILEDKMMSNKRNSKVTMKFLGYLITGVTAMSFFAIVKADVPLLSLEDFLPEICWS